MPQSKKRNVHKHHQDYIPHAKKRKSAVPVAVVFCGIISIGIAFFAAGYSLLWLSIGLIAGIVIGYFVGKEMDKSFEKN